MEKMNSHPKGPMRQLRQKTTKKEQADKHTRKETAKITKENRGKNANGNMQSVTT
jgi:hypothetical protein